MRPALPRCLSFLVAATALMFGAAPAHATYDKPYVGEIKQIRADDEDTFVYIARDYKLGFVEMRAANPGVDPWVPGSGTKLTLPTRHLLPDAPRKGLVINLPEMRMYYYRTADGPPETFPIGIGREGLDTPKGTTTVVRKVDGPVWRPTPRMRREHPELPEVEPPGPNNPMGTHALYLGWPQYAIHGTNRAFGIGRRISSGCIRLYPEDIIALYNMVPVGTQVTVVDQPIKVAWIGDELFLEAHPEVENAIMLEETGRMPAPRLTPQDMDRITKAAGEHKDAIRWSAVRTAIRERRGFPILIARKGGGGEGEAAKAALAAEISGPKKDQDKTKKKKKGAPRPTDVPLTTPAVSYTPHPLATPGGLND